MRAATKLALMAALQHDPNARQVQSRPIGLVASRTPHAEPLRRNRMPVLHASVAHIRFGNACIFGKALRCPACICASLFDLQIIMLAIVRKLEAELLCHLKVGVGFSDLAGYDRIAEGALPVRQRGSGHSSIDLSVAGITW